VPLARTAANLVVDGKPVHALFPRVHAAGKSSGGNLVYHGGAIQKNPKIYAIYWGFDGTATTDPDGVAAYESSFLSGISGTPYYNIMMQYYSTAAGNITDPSGEFGGAWYDTTNAVPRAPTDAQIAAEAVRAAAHFGYDFDAAYVVQTPHGAYHRLSYCAYHSVTSSSNGDVHYANVPYQPDFPGCGTGSVNKPGINDGTSETVAHEVAETQTDPDTRTGWFDKSGNEIGDYCAFINLQNITISTGTFATQPLWSNAAGGCAISYP
jgi:serine protease